MSNLTGEEIAYLESRKMAAHHGQRATAFMESDEWRWFHDMILKSMETEAIETLKRAKDEVGRLRAQQMFLASQKPIEVLEKLKMQGSVAVQELTDFSTQKATPE